MLRNTRFLLFTACLAFAASAASGLTIASASLGGDKACTTLACTMQTHTFSGAIGSGAGSIDLAGLVLTFSIAGVGGAFDPGVSFTNTSYSGSANVVEAVPGLFMITSGSAAIAGDFNGSGFATNAITVGGTCTDAAGALACGLIFSLPGDDGNFYFHTVNLMAAVPEPATAGLLGAALISGLVLRRRR